jgi:hypothetical protein
MKIRRIATSLAVVMISALPAVAASIQSHKPAIFIKADSDFAVALTSAIEKKQVPATVVITPDTAEYTLESAAVYSKDETGAGKIARCLFADCIGMNGFSSVSVRLIRTKDSAVVWAYQVRKANSGPLGIQSMSEAIAKHLKNDYLNKQKD